MCIVFYLFFSVFAFYIAFANKLFSNLLREFHLNYKGPHFESLFKTCSFFLFLFLQKPQKRENRESSNAQQNPIFCYVEGGGVKEKHYVYTTREGWVVKRQKLTLRSLWRAPYYLRQTRLSFSILI